MNKLTLLLLFLCSQSALALAPIEHWMSETGVRVYFMSAPSIPMVDVRLLFDAGGARDGDKYGLAALTAGLLVEGSGGLDAKTMAQRFENVGAQVNKGSYRDMAYIGVRSLSEEEFLSSAMDALVDTVARPDFPQNAINRDKSQIITSLKLKAKRPGYIANKRFIETLFKDYPYGHETSGSEATLAKISRDDVLAYHRQYYVKNNMTLLVIGDLNKTQVEALANQVGRALPAGQVAPKLAKPKPIKNRTDTIEFDSTQSAIMLGTLAPERGSPQNLALQVANYSFGGGGFESRLMKVLRQEHGLTYGVSSGFATMRSGGYFRISMKTAQENSEKALELLKKTRDEYLTGPSREEFVKARKYLMDSFPLNVNSNSKLLGYMGMIAFYGLPLDYLETYTERLANLTHEDVKQAWVTQFEHASWIVQVLKKPDDAK